MTTWTRKDRQVRQDADCLVCGNYYGICKGEHRAHVPSTCRACGTPQCWTQGLARGTCSVCLVGLLDAFPGHKCGYAGCQHDAVATAPRVKYVCREHLKRSKQDTYIEQRLAERSKHWEMLTFDMQAVPLL